MKYEITVCQCGRIHFINEEKINKAIENNKQVLVICNNCGKSNLIGADKQKNEDGEYEYIMYSFNERDTEINDTSRIDNIFFSTGETVRMMTGGGATYYNSSANTFFDTETKKPNNVSCEEWEKRIKTVDIGSTINWIRNNDKLEQLSHYYIGIDWKGTKYETKY